MPFWLKIVFTPLQNLSQHAFYPSWSKIWIVLIYGASYGNISSVCLPDEFLSSPTSVNARAVEISALADGTLLWRAVHGLSLAGSALSCWNWSVHQASTNSSKHKCAASDWACACRAHLARKREALWCLKTRKKEIYHVFLWPRLHIMFLNPDSSWLSIQSMLFTFLTLKPRKFGDWDALFWSWPVQN